MPPLHPAASVPPLHRAASAPQLVLVGSGRLPPLEDLALLLPPQVVLVPPLHPAASVPLLLLAALARPQLVGLERLPLPAGLGLRPQAALAAALADSLIRSVFCSPR